MKNTIGRSLTMITQISITMMVPIFLCVALAVWLDGLFNTIWFMPGCLLLGIGAAFRNGYYLVKSYTRNDKTSEGRTNDYIRELKKKGKANNRAKRQ